MKSPDLFACEGVRRQLLATTMLTALGTGAAFVGPPALAQTADQPAVASGGAIPLPPVDVAGAAGGAGTGGGSGVGGGQPEAPFSQPLPQNIPAVIETVTANEIRQDINAVTSTDTLKYLPSIDLRTRYEGEQNPMIGFRTTSQDTPAQSLVYADGILLSNLLGNYYFYPPVTQMVTPNEISRVDVIYGPFSALYPGNSYGGIVTFSTRMPDQFEAHLAAKGFAQHFDLYDSNGWFPGDNFSLAIGDRFNAFSFWLTYDHLTADSQPLQFTNVPPTSFPFISGLPVTGAVPYTFPNGQPGVLLGSSAIYTDQDDLGKVKLAYDFTPALRLTYTGALWNFTQFQGVTSYIYNQAGVPVYTAPNFFVQDLGQYFGLYGLDPSTQIDQRMMQGLELKSDTHGVFDIDAVVSQLLMLNNQTLQSLKYGLDQTGQNWIQSGSGWITSDLRGIWRPDADFLGHHEISFGGHFDQYALRQYFNNLPDWMSTDNSVPAAESSGITQTKALYVQDAWSFFPDWKLIVGGRQEWWDTFDGANENFGTGTASIGTIPPGTNFYPSRGANGFSPKAALTYQATPDLLLRASYGNAKRFPTVSELYQAAAFPSFTFIPNPNLLPEQVDSYDVTAEYSIGHNSLARLSLFHEDRWNEITFQTIQQGGAPVTTYQNVPKTQFNGIEAALATKDFIYPGVDLNASVTYVGSEILSDPEFHDPNNPYLTANGKNYPLIPRWRAKLLVAYHPTEQWSISGAVRYASNPYNTLDNTDVIHDTYAAISGYLLFDARATYKIDKNISVAAGVNNIGNYQQYDYHPFAQRTYFAELHYDF